MKPPRGDVSAWILVVVAAIFCLLCGCGPTVDPPVKRPETDAMRVVWLQQYGMDEATEPYVIWVEGAQLNCYDGRGWKVRAVPPNVPECVAGIYYDDTRTALVAWPSGPTKISDTAFAHELCHSWNWRYYGNGDGGHAGPCFVPGGYVDQANAALRGAGL